MFLEGTGKKGVHGQDYYDQVLEPVIEPAFNGLSGYTGHKRESLYVLDHAPVHGTRGLLVEAKKKFGSRCTTDLHALPASTP